MCPNPPSDQKSTEAPPPGRRPKGNGIPSLDSPATLPMGRASNERVIDTRFMTIHPRTLEWWGQREKCMQCANLFDRPMVWANGELGNQSTTGGGMVCTAVAIVSRRDTACISAREPAGPCGPDAKLFKPRQAG